MISDDDIAKVREATDLVALIGARSQVRRRGRDYWCCCPLHHEKTPSFKIDPTTQLWHCFGCGEGGDVFKFVMKMDNLTFPEAVLALADAAGIQIEQTGGTGMARGKKRRLVQVCESAADFWHTQLMRGRSEGAAAARQYLAKRGFGSDVCKRWRLGFAPGRGSMISALKSQGFQVSEMQDANVAVKNITGRVNDRFYNRVMFPIFDVAGECIAFGGRVIGEGSPKYLNSSDTPLFRKSKVLFGLDKAKAAMAASGVAVVCEGYTDVIAMHEAGIKNAVATLGTALTSSHIKLLSRHAGKKIIYLFDGDSAGQRATDRALQFVDASLAAVGPGHVDLCALTLPDDLDPADYIAKFGGPALEAELGRAKPLVLFGIERRLAKYDLSSAESKYKALADALSILAPFKDTLLAKDYAVSIAGMLNIAEADVLAELAKQKAPAPITDPDDAEGISRGSAAAAQTRTGQGYGHSQAQGFGASLGVSAASYSPTEINRLKLERETLSVCAQNPFVALTYGPQLQAVKWHDQLHAQLAFTILQSLIENPLSSPADIITAASKLDTRAGSILTAAQNSNEPIESRMKYLLDELKKGDTDSEILRLKTQLKTASPQEQEQIFAKIVELQKQTTS